MRRPIPQRLLTIILLGLCIVANMLIAQIPLRLDFSNGRAYSISSGSRKVVSSLSKPVTITFFSSKNIPSTLKSVRQEINDFLKEYSAQGGAKVMYALRDPDNNKDVLAQMQNYSIPQLQFSQQDQDQFALQKAYFGVGVSYDGKYASLPQVTDIRDLEYNLTSILYKLNTPKLPQVGVIGAAGGLTQLQSLVSVSQSQFNIEETATISAQFKSLIVFGSDAKQYTEDEITQLKKYMQEGGSVLFFIDGVVVNESLIPQDATHNLFGLVRSLGADIQKNLVMSDAAELVSFGQTESTLPTVLPYPYWIKTNEFAKQSLLSNVTILVFPWTSSIEVSKPNETLVRSESRSWLETKNFNLSPETLPKLTNVKTKSVSIVASGRVGKGTFVIIPTSKFIQDGFLSRTNDNLELVMNVLSEYTSGGLLTGIRSRSVEYYPIPQLSDSTKNAIKYSQILLGPILLSLLGFAILLRRSRSK